MERTKLLTLAIIGLLLINAGTLGFLLLRKPPRPDMQREGPSQIIINKLHFDEAQKNLYLETVKTHHAAFEKLTEESRNLHHAYYNLLKLENINMDDADSLNKKIAINQQEIDQLNFNHFIQIKGICNEQQKVLFNELTEEISGFFHNPPPPHQHD